MTIVPGPAVRGAGLLLALFVHALAFSGCGLLAGDDAGEEVRFVYFLWTDQLIEDLAPLAEAAHLLGIHTEAYQQDHDQADLQGSSDVLYEIALATDAALAHREVPQEFHDLEAADRAVEQAEALLTLGRQLADDGEQVARAVQAWLDEPAGEQRAEVQGAITAYGETWAAFQQTFLELDETVGD